MLKSVGGNTELGGGKGKSCNRFSKPNFETLPSPSVPRASLSRDKRSQYSECSGYGSQETGVCSAYTRSGHCLPSAR